MEIRIERLTEDNFNSHSLDNFIRHQVVTECWRNVDGNWILLPVSFVETLYYQMEKLTENMIRFAESKLGSKEYAGWCLAFIEDALEISNHIEVFGGDSAKESCELYKDALRDGVPERGAFVFYDCLCPSENGPVNWGHCGISFGDGRVIHAWDMVRVDDYLGIEKLTALTGDHPKYLGWVALERVLNQKPRV